MDERGKLETIVSGIQPQINAGLHKIEEIRKEERILKDREADILANKDFEYTMTVNKQRKIDVPTGTYVTNCLTCNMTCHEVCRIPNDDGKYGCWAMNGGGQSDAHCRICPGGCFWQKHVNNSYRFELYQEDEIRNSADLKDRYDQAVEGKTKVEAMIDNMESELGEYHGAVVDMVMEGRNCLQRLGEIALKPNPLTSVEYIDLMIEAEKQEKNPGFMDRISAFQGIREDAEIIENLDKQPERISYARAAYNGMKKSVNVFKKIWGGGKN